MRRLLVSFLVGVLAACGARNGLVSGPSPAQTKITQISGAVSIPPAADPTGGRVFEMTFTADPTACVALPEQARIRTFTTTFYGSPVATLTGATFFSSIAPYPTWNVMYTKVVNQFADIWFQDPPIWEALSDESYVVMFGDAHGAFLGNNATLPFWGKWEYCAEREIDGYPECEVPVQSCDSQHHQLTIRLK